MTPDQTRLFILNVRNALTPTERLLDGFEPPILDGLESDALMLATEVFQAKAGLAEAIALLSSAWKDMQHD